MKEQVLATDDGGRLALYTYGAENAPGTRRVVVIGGAFLTALIYRPFAIALAKGLGEGWAVDVYDRRGRGDSSDQPADYSMDTEIADLRLVMDTTGARNILGHSLGGSVALNAAQAFAGTAHQPDTLVVYDAAVNIDGSMDTSWLPGFEKDVNAGRPAHAMAKLRKGMQPSSTLSRVPEPILAGLMAMVSRTRVNRLLRTLLPSGVGELKAAFKEVDDVATFAVLPRRTHFMVGGKSPEYYQDTARRLHAAVPGSTFEVSPEQFHGSIPAAVSELVSDISAFFTATTNEN